MAVKEQVYEALAGAAGAFVSGGELAQALGVSRNAVWKAVCALESEGCEIDSVTGKGYRLVAGDRLTEATVRCHLQTAGLVLDVREEATSTNRLAKELAEQGACEGTVVIAAAQTAGRGRLGRCFCSPPNTGLYMSIILRPMLRAEEALSITTAAAVAVCRAIERVTPRVCRIKWVNDIFCDDKKVCGILTEASLDTETGGLSYAVLGIGINVRDPQGGFPAELQGIAASLYGAQGGDRALLAAAVLDAFFEEYAMLPDKRFVEEYRCRSLLNGRRITVKKPTGDHAATAIEIDTACRLRVRYDDGTEEALSSGDVSIRI